MTPPFHDPRYPRRWAAIPPSFVTAPAPPVGAVFRHFRADWKCWSDMVGEGIAMKNNSPPISRKNDTQNDTQFPPLPDPSSRAPTYAATLRITTSVTPSVGCRHTWPNGWQIVNKRISRKSKKSKSKIRKLRNAHCPTSDELRAPHGNAIGRLPAQTPSFGRANAPRASDMRS